MIQLQKKIVWAVLMSVGPHEEWSGDGHNKLATLGFPIDGIHDKWSGKWLGIWVVPNNQLSDVVAYLWLCIIEEYGGMSIQLTMECGSETTEIYDIVHALWELFDLGLPTDNIPVHNLLRSVHNVAIE
ncbi:hypothetical protein M422DRAFT_174837 [Sphaerobolus stellatus SS14]|uniref:Uncharacterized protein n=1 Tax=Sphaerobolus stellatus (strain SS14) TaxID=990650 RepID=A0A0C9U9A6_SPHS4|nr:hypothetical protein M422DRAFT_174837 [Sphaerobolus stellatus SS14]